MFVGKIENLVIGIFFFKLSDRCVGQKRCGHSLQETEHHLGGVWPLEDIGDPYFHLNTKLALSFYLQSHSYWESRYPLLDSFWFRIICS